MDVFMDAFACSGDHVNGFWKYCSAKLVLQLSQALSSSPLLGPDGLSTLANVKILMSKYHKGLLKVSVRNFSWSLLFIEITSSAKLKYDCRCNIPHLSTATRYIFDLSVALSDCSTSQHVKTRAIAVTITVDHIVGYGSLMYAAWLIL